MSDFMHSAASVLGRFGPPHLAAALAVLLLYVVQAEVRFGKSARASKPGEADRGSTRAISLAVIVPVLGLVFAIESVTLPDARALGFFGLSSPAAMPGMPALACLGVAVAAFGDSYEAYRREVRALIPFLWGAGSRAAPGRSGA